MIFQWKITDPVFLSAGSSGTTRPQHHYDDPEEMPSFDDLMSEDSEDGRENSDPEDSEEDNQEDGDTVGPNPAHVSPYDHPSIIENFKQYDLEAEVRRVSHSRLKNFRMETHQFQLSFKKLHGRQPLIKNVMTPIRYSLVKVINRLKLHYSEMQKDLGETETRQINVTIIHPEIVDGLSASLYTLATPTLDIVDRVMAILTKITNSDQFKLISVNDAFSINVQVLCVDHTIINEQKRAAKLKKSRQILGAFNPEMEENRNFYSKHKSWYYPIPNGFGTSDNVDAFKNKCLLAALAASYIFLVDSETNYITQNKGKDSNKRKTMKALLNTDTNLSERAGNTILAEMNKFRVEKSVMPINDKFIMEDVIPKYSAFRDVQIHVWTTSGTKSVHKYSYPKIYSRKLRQMSLFIKKDQPGHIEAICDLVPFLNSKGGTCLSCGTEYTRLNKHYCRIDVPCKACSRLQILPETKPFRAMHIRLCNSDNPGEDDILKDKRKFSPGNCQACNIYIASGSCSKAHDSICQQRWKCPKESCGKIVCKDPVRNCHIMMRLKHKCGESKCYVCHETSGPDEIHRCAILSGAFQNRWPKLAFIHGTFIDKSKNSCGKCYEIQEQSQDTFDLCDEHKERTFSSFLEMNSLTCLAETDVRGKFNRTCYFASGIDVEILPFEVFKEYFPDEAVAKDIDIRDHTRRSRSTIDKRIRDNGELIMDAKIIKQSGELNIITSFLTNVLSPANRGITYMCHGAGFELCLLATALKMRKIKASVLFKGSRVTCIDLDHYKIRFLNNLNWFSGSLTKLKKEYNLLPDIKYFPSALNHPKCYNYSGSVPDVQNFVEFLDSEDEKIMKQQYVSGRKSSGVKWDFGTELLEHATSHVLLLAALVTSFLKMSFSIQRDMQKSKYCLRKPKSSHLPFIHAYESPLCSVAGFSFQIMKVYFLDVSKLKQITSEFSAIGQFDNCSRAENTYTSYVIHNEVDPKKKAGYRTAFTQSEGQDELLYSEKVVGKGKNKKVIKKHFRPDMIYKDDENKIMEITEVLGCYYHAHFLSETCTNKSLRARHLAKKLDTVNGKNSEAIYESDKKKYKEIKEYWQNKGWIVTIILKRECEWRDQEFTDPTVKAFLKWNKKIPPIYHKRPTRRLCPRVAVRAGSTEAFELLWRKEARPGYELCSEDINSLFGFICATKAFPINSYTILVESELTDVFYDPEKETLLTKKGGIPIVGLCHVRMLAPDNMTFPVLPYRRRDNTTVLALCRTCAEERRFGTCGHKTNARSMTSVWTGAEISYSLQQGYELLNFYECHLYSETEKILAPFYNLMFNYKLKNSGFESGVDKQEYCDKINSDMGYTDEFFKLTPENVKDDPAQRRIFKNISNMSIGKQSQRLDRSQQEIVNSYSELYNLMTKKEISVTHINELNEHIMQITYDRRKQYIPPNRQGSTSCYIYILALSRIEMHKHICNLLKQGMRIYHTDIDSIKYEKKIGSKSPLPQSQAFGHFKKDFPNQEIIRYCSLGPRACSTTLCDKDGNESFHIQAKCFSMDSRLAKEKLEGDVYERLLHNAFDEIIDAVPIPQKRSRVGNVDQVKNELKDMYFTNRISQKRMLVKFGERYVTFPFGTREIKLPEIVQ